MPAGDGPEQPTFDIGEATPVTHLGDESWGVVGLELNMDNSFWGEDDGGSSSCRVVGYVGAHRFSQGAPSKYTYVIEYKGHYYPARHTAVASALLDSVAKRRIRKAHAPPRLLK